MGKLAEVKSQKSTLRRRKAAAARHVRSLQAQADDLEAELKEMKEAPGCLGALFANVLSWNWTCDASVFSEDDESLKPAVEKAASDYGVEVQIIRKSSTERESTTSDYDSSDFIKHFVEIPIDGEILLGA